MAVLDRYEAGIRIATNLQLNFAKTVRVEPIGWQLRYGRTVGWLFAAGVSASSERALFCITALDAKPSDLGMKTELLELAPDGAVELTPYGVREQAS